MNIAKPIPEDFPKSLHDSPLFMSKETLEQYLNLPSSTGQSDLPHFESGGIVYKPTVVRVAEKEPEVVVPVPILEDFMRRMMGSEVYGKAEEAARRYKPAPPDWGNALSMMWLLKSMQLDEARGFPLRTVIRRYFGFLKWRRTMPFMPYHAARSYRTGSASIASGFDSVAANQNVAASKPWYERAYTAIFDDPLFPGQVFERSLTGGNKEPSIWDTDPWPALNRLLGTDVESHDLEQTEKTNARAFMDFRNVLARMEQPIAKLAEGTDGPTSKDMRVEVGEGGEPELVNGKLVRGRRRGTLPAGSTVEKLPGRYFENIRPSLGEIYRRLENVEDARNKSRWARAFRMDDAGTYKDAYEFPGPTARAIARMRRSTNVEDVRGIPWEKRYPSVVGDEEDPDVVAKRMGFEPESRVNEPPGVLGEAAGVGTLDRMIANPEMQRGMVNATIDLSNVQPKETPPVFHPMPLESPQGAVADEPVWQ